MYDDISLCTQKSEEGRHLYHYHFIAWPDHGVPQDPGCVVGFLQDVSLWQNFLSKEGQAPGPIVVHCSAGIGRTGVFIVVDILLNLITYQGGSVLLCQHSHYVHHMGCGWFLCVAYAVV